MDFFILQNKKINKMENKIFCGQCGTANPFESNFCYSCGQKLVKAYSNLGSNEPKREIGSEFNDVQVLLQKLLRSNGFFTITIDDYYVQFSNNLEEQILFCDAVSENYLPTLGDKQKEFKKIGYKLEPGSNYIKILPHDDFDMYTVIDEVKTIFENIYKIKFAKYEMTSDFGD
jgi:hypothetical protein